MADRASNRDRAVIEYFNFLEDRFWGEAEPPTRKEKPRTVAEPEGESLIDNGPRKT